jgi:hypothetical protein
MFLKEIWMLVKSPYQSTVCEGIQYLYGNNIVGPPPECGEEQPGLFENGEEPPPENEGDNDEDGDNRNIFDRMGLPRKRTS